MRKFLKVFAAAVAAVVVAGYLIPERKAMPFCTPADYNHNTFWYWPWTRGENGHPHTGVDICQLNSNMITLELGMRNSPCVIPYDADQHSFQPYAES